MDAAAVAISDGSGEWARRHGKGEKMGIRTREEYIESLKKQRPNIYMDGEKIEDMVDHPAFQVGLNSAAVTFDQANDPAYRDLARVWSPIVDEEISRWTHLMQDERDALAKVELMKALGDLLCPCYYRCMTSDLLQSAWAVSFEIDGNHNTSYHQNVVEIVKQAQRNDWIIGGGIVSPKGDRSKGPSEQADPDMYLHVVEKRADGIVVRGAKAHGTAAPYTDMLCIAEMQFLPDYCVGFFTPVDTEGITYICKAAHAPSEAKEMDNPLSSKFGGHVEAMIVFDDVLVPWERVFMCGECESILTFGPMLAASHLWHKCMCRWANMDLSIGATALIADYNSVEGAPHVQDHMNEMAMDAEMVYSCAVAAAVEGWKHDSGVYCPKMAPVAAGKVYSARKLGENRYYMQDAAGGLVATMASEKDYRSPIVGKYLEKYYRGREGVPTENRVRAFKLIEDMTASEFAGWYHVMCITGGGAVQTFKGLAGMECDFERCKSKARLAAGIEE
jgi:4-hydroxybutyryl-CoA dehydratase/vinylacetyl-CoA-Delta-isomerase